MQLKKGDRLPFERLKTVSGREVNLHDNGPRRLMHLHLARHSGCCTCNFHMRKYSASMDAVAKRNIEVFFILHSTADVIVENQLETKWARGLNFVSDPERLIYKAVGAEMGGIGVFSWAGFKIVAKNWKDFNFKRLGNENGDTQKPADILIDASNGEILAIYYGSSWTDRWTVEQILDYESLISQT